MLPYSMPLLTMLTMSLLPSSGGLCEVGVQDRAIIYVDRPCSLGHLGLEGQAGSSIWSCLIPVYEGRHEGGILVAGKEQSRAGVRDYKGPFLQGDLAVGSLGLSLGPGGGLAGGVQLGREEPVGLVAGARSW